MKDKRNMKNKRNRVFFITVIFCMVLALQAFASETPVTKIGIKRIEATDTANGYLEVGPASGTQPGQFFSYPHGEQFLPGDTAEGILCLQLPAELEPVTFTLKAAISNKDEGIFGAAVLQVIEGGKTVYEKTLPEFAYSLSFGRTGTEPAEKNIYLKLVFPKNGDQTELQKLKAQQLKFELKLTADLMDYAVKRYALNTDNRIEVYQAFYNNRYYYTESGTPSTENYYAEGTLTADQEKTYLSDYQVIPGKTLDSAESYYIDHKDGNRRVFIGEADLHFGTADDAKALTDSRGEENGTNVRRGDPSLPAEKQFDGLHYTNGADGIPGTADDKRIYAGSSGYGSADDYYIDDEDGDLFVYAGTDLKFGTEDDVKALEKSAGVKNGTGVLRGDPALEAGLQFGGENHAGGDHYYVGNDRIPGTADDKLIRPGYDGTYGKAGNYYLDDEDGDLEVYIGKDLCFGTADDAKALVKETGDRNGTNVLRGSETAVSEQFGGTGHAGGKHLTSGRDGIPGNSDDKTVSAGTDKTYGTADDFYLEGKKEVYSAEDLIFGTADDAMKLDSGSNVRRGSAPEPSEQFGGSDRTGGSHYTNGPDTVPGTADDKLIYRTPEQEYAYYIDGADGRSVYIGEDKTFGTADDAKLLDNGTNVRRGSSESAAEQFGGTGYLEGAHYWNGADGIPATADDRVLNRGTDGAFFTSDDHYADGADGLLVYAAEDECFGTEDDAKALKDSQGNLTGANVRRGTETAAAKQFGGTGNAGGDHYYSGNDLIWGTADDELWDTGSDNKHGSWDDRKLGYPRDTSQKDTKSSWSGGGAVSGSFDSSVSPVGFAKAVEGTWTKDAFGRWSFVSEDGVQAKSKWVNIYNKSLGTSDWFYFDANGIMQTGWQKTGNGKWYCLRTAEDARYGAMEKGLYQDSSDGNFYYLDPVTGIMQTGWQKINGKYYYFAEESTGTSWFWNSQIGRWASRMLGGHPYGAMYRNEKTPDGHQVDATGARID